MLKVAFFRNLNFGHPGSPTRTQLEDAFRMAGASVVRSVQGNGTVVFDDADLAVVANALAPVGFREPFMVRSAQQVRTIAGRAGRIEPSESAYRRMVTPFEGRLKLGDLPERPLIQPLLIRDGLMISDIWVKGKSVGNPTLLVEAVTKQAAATSRTTGTISRVLKVADSV